MGRQHAHAVVREPGSHHGTHEKGTFLLSFCWCSSNRSRVVAAAGAAAAALAEAVAAIVVATVAEVAVEAALAVAAAAVWGCQKRSLA